MVFAQSIGAPSTVTFRPPSTCKVRPVAVTIRSASISAPEASFKPVWVNDSMVSVTTDARPAFIALNRSPSGTRHRRCSHGL